MDEVLKDADVIEIKHDPRRGNHVQEPKQKIEI